jgi:hypothetical protein
LSQPNDPYAPPQALDAVEGESNALRTSFGLRRAGWTFGLWLVGWSLASGAVMFALNDHPLDRLGGDNLETDLVKLAILNGNGPRIAVLAACQAAVVFVHHDRTARPRTSWTIFALSPAGVPFALVLAYLAGALASEVPADVGHMEFFAMMLRSMTVLQLLLAIAGGGLYAAILAPLAVPYFPVLTRHVPRVWLRFVVVWFAVALVTASVDYAIGRGALALLRR